MSWEQRVSRMVAGFALGEFLVAMVLLSVLVTPMLRTLPASIAHAAAVEPFSLMVATRVYWAEKWATEGIGDPAATAPHDYTVEGKYSASIANTVGDGAQSFEFNDLITGLEGGVVTFRAALPSDGGGHAIVWVCGHRQAPQGFTVRGENHTSLDGGALPALCRERPR